MMKVAYCNMESICSQLLTFMWRIVSEGLVISIHDGYTELNKTNESFLEITLEKYLGVYSMVSTVTLANIHVIRFLYSFLFLTHAYQF